MGFKRASLRYVTSWLALDDIGLLFVCGDGPQVLRVLFISVLNGPRGLRGPRVIGSGLYNMPKNGLIKLIFKNGCKTEPRNYRGITLTCCIGKFFNQILYARLTEFFQKYHIFPDNIMGVRPSMRTSNNIFILKSLIEKALNKKRKTVLFFCRHFKSF